MAGIVQEVPGPEEIIREFGALLDLADGGADSYVSTPAARGNGRIFGGQVIAQALMAAVLTVQPQRRVHSLHGYFLRTGQPLEPIRFAVARDRDGGSFSSRRVVAEQGGKPIFTLAASFHDEQPGFSYQSAMPDVPPPEQLRSEIDIRAEQLADIPNRRGFMLRGATIDIRPTHAHDYRDSRPAPPVQSYWVRPVAPLPDDDRLHMAFLAYCSDFLLLSTTLRPHGVHWVTHPIQNASLDHAMWIHAQPRFDDWLLYCQETPWSGGARGLGRGTFFDRSGRMIASVAQEGLIRALDPALLAGAKGEP